MNNRVSHVFILLFVLYDDQTSFPLCLYRLHVIKLWQHLPVKQKSLLINQCVNQDKKMFIKYCRFSKSWNSLFDRQIITLGKTDWSQAEPMTALCNIKYFLEMSDEYVYWLYTLMLN